MQPSPLPHVQIFVEVPRGEIRMRHRVLCQQLPLRENIQAVIALPFIREIGKHPFADAGLLKLEKI